jgi:hypothetical protein
MLTQIARIVTGGENAAGMDLEWVPSPMLADQAMPAAP